MKDRYSSLLFRGIGTLLFLAPLKFSLPTVLADFKVGEQTLGMWIWGSWPNFIFYILVTMVFLFFLYLGWCGEKLWNSKFHFWVPMAFLGGQGISTLLSEDPLLSLSIFILLASLVLAYWMGYRTASHSDSMGVYLNFFWMSCVLVVAVGIFQNHGGMDMTREYLKHHPEILVDHPELAGKVMMKRVFSTFVTPNALGGYIISSLFLMGILFWKNRKSMSDLMIHFVLILGMFYCLILSFSKGSYLSLFIGIVITGIVFGLRSRRAWLIISGLCLLMVMGFLWGFGSYAIERGKTTWNARMGYWSAALQIGKEHPVWGSGPGTFSKKFSKYQKPGEEGSKLVHNNYLQMWSDSGSTGFLTFSVWTLGALILAARRLRVRTSLDGVLIWGACLVFTIHSLVDFDLYMIGNSWPIFLWMGFLQREP